MEQTRIEALRRRIDDERRTSGKGRPRFSDKLRRDVCALLNEPGWNHVRVGKALGLSESSLYRWSPRTSKSPQAAKKKRGLPSMKHMRIVSGEPRYPVSSTGLRLELSNGAFVSGLSLDDVAELVRRLS